MSYILLVFIPLGAKRFYSVNRIVSKKGLNKMEKKIIPGAIIFAAAVVGVLVNMPIAEASQVASAMVK